ncbi:hypothetical protein V2J09_008342 [Rumex salicifolius]
MLSRFISRSTRYQLSRLNINFSSTLHTPPPLPSPALYSPSSPNLSPPFYTLRFFSSGNRNGDDGNRNRQSTSDLWKLTSENDDSGVFGTYDGDLKGFDGEAEVHEPSWAEERGGSDAAAESDVFQGVKSAGSGSGGANMWEEAVGVGGDSDFKPWTLEGDEKLENMFTSIEEETVAAREVEAGLREEEQKKKLEELALLQEEEEALIPIVKGPNRAFGDLVAASGISDDMLDSLMALKNFEGVDGLPPLTEIEDMRYESSLKNYTRAEMERLKQEEIAKSRVRTVDEQGRAYGTGRRKCSIARVWVEPGNGKFLVNDKEFDVYFPMLDHRAALLRPLSETKTLGLWDIKCTVKGGGVSGQVGAVQLGISRALQNWEPGLRPPLREAGFLTRDPRAVERKKPGKAKARKSFQWVKR